MGRRNLAAVGTHRNYYADMLDDSTGENPSLVTGCASPEDAASSYFRNVFENSGGLLQSAIVVVWSASGDHVLRRLYEMTASITPCSAIDAEPDEFEVVISVREMPNCEGPADRRI